MFAAEYEPALLTNRQRASRAPVSLDATLGRGGLDRTLCKVADLSPHGARVQTYSALKANARIWLTLPRIGRIIARVIWADDFAAGCQFDVPLGQQVFDELVALN